MMAPNAYICIASDWTRKILELLCVLDVTTFRLLTGGCHRPQLYSVDG